MAREPLRGCPHLQPLPRAPALFRRDEHLRNCHHLLHILRDRFSVADLDAQDAQLAAKNRQGRRIHCPSNDRRHPSGGSRNDQSPNESHLGSGRIYKAGRRFSLYAAHRKRKPVARASDESVGLSAATAPLISMDTRLCLGLNCILKPPI